MSKASFKRAVFAASLMAATALTQPAFATVYNDTVGDTFVGVGGNGILDIVKVEVSNSISDLIFKISLNNDVVVTDWGKYCIAINTTAGGDSVGNGWGRPISMTAGMDWWVGSWVDGGNGVQLWQYTASWATTGAPTISKSGSNVTINVPFIGMGLNIGSNFTFDVISSGGGNGDSAIDSLANPAQSVATWAGPYDISSVAVPSYTLVQPPDPTNNVTFLVDMQVPIALYNANFSDPKGFNTNSDTLYVRGNFNGWATPSTNFAFKQIGPTLFSNTVAIVWPNNGTIQYKFFGDAFPQEEAPVLSCNNSRTLTITNTTMNAGLAYWSDRKTNDPTVTVTYSVDMAFQQLLGTFTNGVNPVYVAGYFNGWAINGTAMTNNPVPNTNIYTAVVELPYTPIGSCFNPYKFTYQSPDTWESPISTAGGNRTFTVSSTNQVLPTVFWNDQTPCDLLTTNVAVTFNIDMTGAIGTDGMVYESGTGTNIYINGDFSGWWAWGPNGTPNSGNATYAMTKNPTSDVWSITLNRPAGSGLTFTYKYSLGGPDNEAGFAVNHFRYVRTPSAGATTYNLPVDKFINTNPNVPREETAVGGLAAAPSTPGNVLLSWTGLPCAQMQGSTSVTGPYTDLFEARGVASTNVATSGGQRFFRLKR